MVSALARRRAGLVGITTGLYGAGGFGKTTLARMACADPRVRRRFGGRVFFVTIGRDVRGSAAIAAKVNELIELLTSEDVSFTDPELAGQRLGGLFDSGRAGCSSLTMSGISRSLRLLLPADDGARAWSLRGTHGCWPVPVRSAWIR